MNYKTLLNDPKWVAKNWTPYLGRKMKEKHQPCACGNHSAETACIARVWTCIECHAKDHISDMQGETCGISDDFNYFLKPLDGIVADLDAGFFAMEEIERDRARAIAM